MSWKPSIRDHCFLLAKFINEYNIMTIYTIIILSFTMILFPFSLLLADIIFISRIAGRRLMPCNFNLLMDVISLLDCRFCKNKISISLSTFQRPVLAHPQREIQTRRRTAEGREDHPVRPRPARGLSTGAGPPQVGPAGTHRTPVRGLVQGQTHSLRNAHRLNIPFSRTVGFGSH